MLKIKNALVLSFCLYFACPLTAQPSDARLQDILSKMKTAEGYSTGITIEVNDKEGNPLYDEEASVMKYGANFFYRLGDAEAILNDSLYISIDHQMKIVQYAPRSAMQDQLNLNLNQLVPDSAIAALTGRAQIAETAEGWTLTMPGVNGQYRDLKYSVGHDYALRQVSYTVQDDIRVNIVYHNFQYAADPNDDAFSTHRVLADRNNLTPAYRDYQLYKRN